MEEEKESKKLRIALAGNPNSGKTTLFNALTGSNQHVGNWPGVTMEAKEGALLGNARIRLVDLPGIYSLSPYTLEEVITRDYLFNEQPDAILNIVDGTNPERNLYLTTQLLETGLPIVVAVNLMDEVEKASATPDLEMLAKKLGCPVVGISALHHKGIQELAETVIAVATSKQRPAPLRFAAEVEEELATVERIAAAELPRRNRRWYTIKVWENDELALAELALSAQTKAAVKKATMKEDGMEQDAESIIADARYNLITDMLTEIKAQSLSLTASEKIDRVVTNRWLGLPIFALVMFLVYYISVSTVGTWATDWANEDLFGDGFHLFGIGSEAYETDMDAYAQQYLFTPELEAIMAQAAAAGAIGADEVFGSMENGDFGDFEEAFATYGEALAEDGYDISEEVAAAMESAPATEDYGIWVPGIPVIFTEIMEAMNVSPWLQSLVIDGIIGGVGAVLGFVPQMVVLFTLLAILEGCGYMARIAFILDRAFRQIGLSGKSFIPILIGTGCAVPGIMASRTIRNERERRLTIITTTFIPCSAKLPIIALIAAALFGGAWWVGPSAYFLGIGAIIISGIMLKKTELFAGDPSPFVMELPPYRRPSLMNVWHSVAERAMSFIYKAGTIILLSSIVIWATSSFGWSAGEFVFNPEMELENSLLGYFGVSVAWIFAPLGFADIRATVATVMGLVAKEEIVAVFGVLDFADLTPLAAYAFLAFNLLCAPCFAAIGAIRREMNSAKWTVFAVGYQCIFAYAIALLIYQYGIYWQTGEFTVGTMAAIMITSLILYYLFKPYKESSRRRYGSSLLVHREKA